jgi:spoIIIJ-associated protein
MEEKVSEILENILGLLALEGSFEVVEGPESVNVSIETSDPGRLIGFRGETLDALQLLVNQILSRKIGDEKFKRAVIDVASWRQKKETELEERAKKWAEEVKQSGSPLELESMPSWQRRIIHIIVSEIEGIESESLGEGRDRHLVIKPSLKKPSSKKASKKKEPKEEKITEFG